MTGTSMPGFSKTPARSCAPVGLFSAAGTPPNEEQVPAVMIALALRAARANCSAYGSSPNVQASGILAGTAPSTIKIYPPWFDDFVDDFHRLIAGGGGQRLMKAQADVAREQFVGRDGFRIQQRNRTTGTTLALQPQHRRQTLRQFFQRLGHARNRRGAQAQQHAQAGAQLQK